MMRRYDRWRAVRSTEGYSRRRDVLIVKVTLIAVIILVLIAMICGCVHLVKKASAKDTEIPVVQEAVVTVRPEPEIIITQVAAPKPTEVPVEEDKLCIVLDAGHGGVDGGTYYGEVLEKNINLAVTQYIKENLEAEGAEVLLTRSDDVFLEVSERVDLVDGKEADLFVSIHCNFFEGDDSVSGLECYYYEGKEAGQACAELMIESMKDNKDIKVRSARHGNYYVLKHTEIPAVLVEMGFLSNKAEREKLNSADYQKILAKELTEGILLYLSQETE